MYRINLFKNLKSPNNPLTITSQDYIEYVKNGCNKEQVLTARNYDKSSKSYNSIKSNRLCVTHNFLFKDYKKDSNIISSTGLLYFDIDTNLDFNTIDDSRVYIHHKSFGGNGSSIIVQASGITTDNFKTSYFSIADDLGISKYMDVDAIKKSQYTVISYDPQLYFNPNSFVFPPTEPKKVSFRGNMSSSANLPRNDTFLIDGNAILPYRTTNASDYVEANKEYQVYPEGIKTAKIDIPRNIAVGKRTKVLMAIMNQVLAINKNLTKEQVLNKALNINQIFTNNPLPIENVIGIVKSIFRYQTEGTLKPINNKVRKVIFSEKSKLTKEEKISIVNKEVGAMRTKNTKQRIYNVIETWNKSGKITIKKIAEELKLGEATVKRNWKEFKVLVQNYNNKLTKVK